MLLTAGIDSGNQAVVRVSTRAGRLKTVALGPTKHSGWIAALPFSVVIDVVGSLFFAVLLVASLDDDDC